MSSQTDFYRKMLNHFGWTWLETKRYKRLFGDPRRKKERIATKLAKSYSKRMVRKEIDNETQDD